MTAACSIDSVIESFERKRSRDRSTPLSDFLPPLDSADFSALLTELIRVDLEYSWEEGQPRRLEEYLTSYPQLQTDPSALSSIAYEEYRQRLQAGETPSAAEYHRRYHIDTRNWPVSVPLDDPASSLPSLSQDQPTLQRSHEVLIGSTSPPSPPSYFQDTLQPKLPHVGSHFLDFNLESELGQGAFGKVYLAKQKGLANRPVALKITQRKQHEPQTLARLRHTNIMPIHSVHEAGPFQAICMPYLGRTTLADILAALRREQHLPSTGSWWASQVTGNESQAAAAQWNQTTYVNVVLSLARKMAAGLAHAHGIGVIHRDIKPANILLSNDGEPLLLDFNLAVLLDQDGALAAIAGTLPYLAPEQLQSLVKGQGTHGSRQADVYALGLILFELLTAHPAYPAVKHDTLIGYVAELARQRRSPPPSLRTLNKAISPALAAIIDKCLAHSPNDRYADAGQLLEDLQRQQHHRPLRFAPNRSVLERCGKWYRRHPKFIRNGLLIGIAGFALAAGVVAYQRHQAEQRLYYRTEWAQSLEKLKRADRLATSIWPTRLPEAAQLIEQVLHDVPTQPAALEQSKLAQFLTHSSRQLLPASIAQALLLQARLNELQAARARTPEEKQAWHSKALASNARARDWCQAAGIPLLASSQEQLLTSPGISADVKRLLASPPESLNARELAGIAYILLDQQHWLEAAALTRQVIDREPAWAGAWFLHGLVYARGGQLLQALHGFETALALEPGDAVALHFRGKVRLQTGDLQGALADFDRALLLDASPADVLADKALALTSSRKPAEAVAALDQAIKFDNTQPRLFLMRARARTAVGDLNGAAEDRRLALAAKPLSELDHLTRGIALREEHKFQEALVEFQAAEQLAPYNLPAFENQSEILGEQLNKPPEALAVLDRAIDNIPQSALLHASRAVYHARLGHRLEAHRDVQTTLRLDAMPQPLTLYQIACVYALTSRISSSDAYQAIAYLTLALEKNFGREYLSSDADLNPIRNRPEFKELLKQYLK